MAFGILLRRILAVRYTAKPDAAGAVDGVGLCRMFNRATRGHAPPTDLSSDHDRLFEFHRWQANLRILDIEAIKTVPYAPLSHPFVERLSGTIRRECLDCTLLWTAADLERKLFEFQGYYNKYRAHAGLDGAAHNLRFATNRRKRTAKADITRSPVRMQPR